MIQRNNNIMLVRRSGGAFTLTEIVAAIVILALITSTSLVVINHCLEVTVDLRIRMAAFSLARDNMEKLLGVDSIQESVDYGDSNDVPGLSWETRVEPFSEPHGSGMWLRAVSSASWYDINGEPKTVEFTQWLTDLSQEDVSRILQRQQQQQDFLDEQTLARAEDLYQKALDARSAAAAAGYGDMVDICREIISDYPSTAVADKARALLRELPLDQKRAFDVKPYETLPSTPSTDAGSGTGSVDAATDRSDSIGAQSTSQQSTE
jgi:hypothetical protein